MQTIAEASLPRRKLSLSIEEPVRLGKLVFPRFAADPAKYGESANSDRRATIWNEEMLRTVLWPIVEEVVDMGSYDDVMEDEKVNHELGFKNVDRKDLHRRFKTGYDIIEKLVQIDSRDAAQAALAIVFLAGFLQREGDDPLQDNDSSSAAFETHQWLYDTFLQGISHYLKHIQLTDFGRPSTATTAGDVANLNSRRERLLQQFVVEWVRFKWFVEVISEIFSQVDMHHSEPHLALPLKAFAYGKFREIVYSPEVRRKILEGRMMILEENSVQGQELLGRVIGATVELDERTSNASTRLELVKSDENWVSKVKSTQTDLTSKGLYVPDVLWNHILKFYGEERYLDEPFFAEGRIVRLVYPKGGSSECQVVKVNDQKRNLRLQMALNNSSITVSQFDPRLVVSSSFNRNDNNLLGDADGDGPLPIIDITSELVD
eukprot:TRINITY_DN2009_c0_g1_i1.p1 TRINITY_DN2009_c0_g1~~TRINITY_DN2009_c0_g1_i1.p1  ORF type:complete len:433 (-),score=98.94 TRINITY_DN2009_c0_g1_i1:223-1521(-)